MVRGAVRTLGAIASLPVPILPLILLPPVLSWAVNVVHSEWAKHPVNDLLISAQSAELCACNVSNATRRRS